MTKHFPIVNLDVQTVYIEKDGNHQKVYKPNHYLLWPIKEVASRYNTEREPCPVQTTACRKS